MDAFTTCLQGGIDMESFCMIGILIIVFLIYLCVYVLTYERRQQRLKDVLNKMKECLEKLEEMDGES